CPEDPHSTALPAHPVTAPDESDSLGHPLPPVTASDETDTLGPLLPPVTATDETDTLGPHLPPVTASDESDAIGRLLPPVADHAEPAHVAFGTEVALPQAPQTIPESNDRLVRHLFDIGLQLHTVRAVFEQEFSTPEQLRAARAAVVTVLDDLDTLIRDAGTAMLDLAVQQAPTAPARTRRRRRR
ncbi:hypothetical protein, partial [Nocardia wallacei]|uniref:hypothetical protein n=1 Tax=Nocardia wallacei TaxID=480035 RepID=UPI00245769D2